MKVLLAQLSPRRADPVRNAATVEDVIRGHPEADLAVFPELFLSAYLLRGLNAVVSDCEMQLERIRAAAKQTATAIVVGLPIETAERIANAAACIDATGELVAIYRKTHLFGTEADVFAAGGQVMVVQLAGTAVAPLICFDVEFPEPVRAACRAGAELLVVPSANMEPFYADHELLTRARALENRRPLVYVNQVGSSGRHKFVGGSRAVDANGNVLVELPREDEAVVVVDIPIGANVDSRVDYLLYAGFDSDSLADKLTDQRHLRS